MKRSLLLAACVVGLFATAVFAQGTATVDFTNNANVANPTFTVNSGDTFDVTFNILSGTSPTLSVVSGYDLFIQSDSANVNNNFSILSRTVTYSGTNAGLPPYPDTITTTGSDQEGFAQNTHDQGQSLDSDQNVPTSLLTLEIQVGAGTPTGSYLFENTPSTGKATLIFGGPSADGQDFYQYSVNLATFTVDVTAVPEPSTWLAGVGVLGVIGYTVLRRRATA